MILFVVFTHSISDYILTPPFIQSNISEIGNWSVIGSAVALKKIIRLTSVVTNSYGGVCHRVPTNFRDWRAEIEISAKDGNGGRGFWFFFTDEFCPEFPLRWTGLSLWINTSDVDRMGRSPIFMHNNNNETTNLSLIQPIGRVLVRSNEFIPKMVITKRGSSIELAFTSGERTFTTETKFAHIIETGYFSFASMTTNYADNNDLHSIMVFPLSPLTNSHESVDFSAINRKILLDNVINRRVMKRRRRVNMQTSSSYYTDAISAQSKLGTDKKHMLNDSVKIISEIKSRAMVTITAESLKHFILPSVDRTIEKANSKVNLGNERFLETQSDFREVYIGLNNQLRALTNECISNMSLMTEEIVSLAHTLMKNEVHDSISPVPLDENVNNSNILIIICVVELILYLVFFVYKRRKTDHFRKAD